VLRVTVNGISTSTPGTLRQACAAALDVARVQEGTWRVLVDPCTQGGTPAMYDVTGRPGRWGHPRLVEAVTADNETGVRA